MKNRNWFWGIFCILAAVYIIASQFGSFAKIGFFSIIASVLLISIIIKSIISRNFYGIFIPLALIYSIYNSPLGLPEVSVWLLISAAVLLSVGLDCIIPKSWHFYQKGKKKYNYTSKEDIDDNNPYAKLSFGASTKYLHADSLKSGYFDVSFGALEVYFDQSRLDPDGAEIVVNCSFGSLDLYIPRDWAVIEDIKATLAGVESYNHTANSPEYSPTLRITGRVSLGAVEIHYI